MNHQKVDSSCVDSVGYDPEGRTMEVRFVSGAIYRYSNVSPDEHREVVEAASVGSAFWRIIRRNEAEHPYERIA